MVLHWAVEREGTTLLKGTFCGINNAQIVATCVVFTHSDRLRGDDEIVVTGPAAPDTRWLVIETADGLSVGEGMEKDDATGQWHLA